ncbi:hypothetical protein VTK56DRAFT_6911 [Thermocarpiscus australiensis]
MATAQPTFQILKLSQRKRDRHRPEAYRAVLPPRHLYPVFVSKLGPAISYISMHIPAATWYLILTSSFIYCSAISYLAVLLFLSSWSILPDHIYRLCNELTPLPRCVMDASPLSLSTADGPGAVRAPDLCDLCELLLSRSGTARRLSVRMAGRVAASQFALEDWLGCTAMLTSIAGTVMSIFCMPNRLM